MILLLPSFSIKDVLSVEMSLFEKEIYPKKKEGNGRIIELEKFKTYNLSRINLWRVYKLILDQMCLFMRHNDDTHFLSEDQSECVMSDSDMNFIIENNNTPHIIENDDPMTYSEAVISRNSDRWLKAIKFEMDFLYINQVWTLVEVPVGVTQ